MQAARKLKIKYPFAILAIALYSLGIAVPAQAEPGIAILKEVSVDQGQTFFDANTSATAPATVVGAGAVYRLTVTNEGDVDLDTVIVSDIGLGNDPVDFFVGNLLVGDFVVLSEIEIPELDQPGRCQNPGDVTNVATVRGRFDSNTNGNNIVMDSDPAVVRCVTENIELLKEVSVDGGANFFDANDSVGAPVTALGADALYRLTVSNMGTSDLFNVRINDAALGIVDFPVGNLGIGQTSVFTGTEIPQLEQPARCQTEGDVTNIASVDGQSAATNNNVSDSDPAVVRCVEESVEIVKEVSVDGGVTFFDANDGDAAPATPVGGNAVYQLTVTNTGTSGLVNVTVNDAALGIANFPVEDLAPDETVVLTAGEIPQLDQPGRCLDPGDVTNIADVAAQSIATSNTVTDSDPAVVRCKVEDIDLVKEVSVDGGATFLDANDGADAPETTVGNSARYRLTVMNSGTSDLQDVVLNDPGIGIVDFAVGDIAAGQTVILTAAEIPQLRQTARCQTPGDVTNIATADGTSVDTGNNVSDSDPAVVRCIPAPPIACRVTGGLNGTFGGNRYHAAGQAGASTALQPQPKGEWTHTQQRGPAGRFTFHGGTSSGPQGTEINEIRCSDPDGCRPSGNPPSPAKQIDFNGIGTFRNIGKGRKTPDFVRAGANVTAEGKGNKRFDGTFHWFEVNIDDLGEPGNSNSNKNPGDADSAICPAIGFGENGARPLADCGCSDFYRITIYDGVSASDVVKNPDGSIDPGQMNRTDVIYEVWGFLDGGNLQIHQLTGKDRKN